MKFFNLFFLWTQNTGVIKLKITVEQLWQNNNPSNTNTSISANKQKNTFPQPEKLKMNKPYPFFMTCYSQSTSYPSPFPDTAITHTGLDLSSVVQRSSERSLAPTKHLAVLSIIMTNRVSTVLQMILSLPASIYNCK